MTISNAERAAWLAEKQNCIGAGDWAGILGEDPFASPLDVYVSKVGEVSERDKLHLAYGRNVEGAIAQALQYKTGRSVTDIGATVITYHPDINYLGATLDRVIKGSEAYPALAGGPGVGEMKHFSPLQMRRDPATGKMKRVYVTPEMWRDDPPINNLIQVQAQMFCGEFEWGCLASMHPGYHLEWIDRERDDAFIDAAMPAIEDFWRRVQDKDPPPPEGPKCLDAVKRLYSTETGETVTLDPAMRELADKWEVAKAAGREAASVAKECEAKIRAEIGSATFGDLGDGTLLTLKTTKRKGYTRVVEASEFRTLRRTRPKNM